MELKIVIAVDGHAACGKSTIAKDLAKKLGYKYIDSGAMYRAVTLFFLRHKVDFHKTKEVLKVLRSIEIRFEIIDGQNTTFLNGENVEEDIREMKVSKNVSDVAAISEVRKAMVAQQQQMGSEKGVVMDGRDIGTVVFQDAELKIFLTANMEVRTQRRLIELMERGFDINEDEIRENLLHRDYIDSNRDDSPLRQAEDAVLIDNSFLSPEQQLEIVLKLAKEAIIKSKKTAEA